jgi:hypothetical protein
MTRVVEPLQRRRGRVYGGVGSRSTCTAVGALLYLVWDCAGSRTGAAIDGYPLTF